MLSQQFMVRKCITCQNLIISDLTGLLKYAESLLNKKAAKQKIAAFLFNKHAAYFNSPIISG